MSGRNDLIRVTLKTCVIYMNSQGVTMGIIKKIHSILTNKCICVKCGEAKSAEEFYFARRKIDNYVPRRSNECKTCSKKRRKEHYTENREELLSNRRFRSYGLSKDEYNEMLDNQGNTCAICKRKEWTRATITDNIMALSVDHCHVTGNVRGLLCRACNLALGQFEDNIKTLNKAIKYLEQAGESNVQTTT
jgi:hypothetical protein